MSKAFWAIVAILLIGLVAFLAVNKRSKQTPTVSGEPSSLQAGDHVLGSRNAKVVLIEYGDYQCPSCKVWQTSVEELKTKTGDDVALVFRNFPITTAHKNALAASRAAEAAALQNKFWEMGSLLYRNQDAWSGVDSPETTFEQYATQLSLNMDQFKSDYKSSKVLDKINLDRDMATKQDVKGTPTFFLNGKLLDLKDASQSENALIKAVDEELKK
jgi:protein-disulfide isomerase